MAKWLVELCGECENRIIVQQEKEIKKLQEDLHQSNLRLVECFPYLPEPMRKKFERILGVD